MPLLHVNILKSIYSYLVKIKGKNKKAEGLARTAYGKGRKVEWVMMTWKRDGATVCVCLSPLLVGLSFLCPLTFPYFPFLLPLFVSCK